MPIGYWVDEPLGCTVSVWDGAITPECVREHLMRLADCAGWPPGPLHLSDLTTVGDVSVPDPELLDLLYEGTHLVDELKVAVVVRPEFLGTSSVRYAAGSSAMGATSFTDFDLACAHLGVSGATVRVIIDEIREELGDSG